MIHWRSMTSGANRERWSRTRHRRRIQPIFAEKTIFQTGIPRAGIISLIVIYSPGAFVKPNEIINLVTSTMKTSDSIRGRSSKRVRYTISH